VACPYGNTLQPIDLTTDQTGSPIPVGQTPYGVVIAPDGSTVYAVNFNGTSSTDTIATVTPINAATRTPGAAIRLSGPEAFDGAITPDGRTLVIGVWGNCCTSAIDVVDTVSDTVTAVIGVGSAPTGIAISPDGHIAYVASWINNSIVAVDLSSDSVKLTRLGIGTYGLAITPDGKQLISSDKSGTEADILDAATLSTLGFVETGSFPEGVAITPDQAPVAALAAEEGHTGSAVVLDASRSHGTSTPIASYAWNFGDGATAVTTGPSIRHVYQHSGVFNATVTVTDEGGTSTQRVFTGQTMLRNGDQTAVASVGVTVCGRPTLRPGAEDLPAAAQVDAGRARPGCESREGR
jgi:YVTN family beta-propeller protein